jgi:glycosyltransferase involved in cell wall biosynthesis
MTTEDRVHFLGEREDVPQLVPHFDCLWLASSYEGQSNAIMEAMSAGVPVVATDIPGNRDLVVHGETGYLVSVGDRSAIARQTKLLLEDPELAARMGAAGRQRMRDEFSVEKMVDRHATLYEQLNAG